MYGVQMPKMLKMDGYDDCIIGTVVRAGQEPILCYGKAKVLAKLVDEGMSDEEAEEFFEFNQLGAWMGEATPCFLISVDELDLYDEP